MVFLSRSPNRFVGNAPQFIRFGDAAPPHEVGRRQPGLPIVAARSCDVPRLTYVA
jgi:hypothetical protein